MSKTCRANKGHEYYEASLKISTVILFKRSNEDFPNEVGSDSVSKPLDPVNSLKLEAICHRNFVSTPCTMHPLLTMPFDLHHATMPLLWKSERYNSWLINMRPWSKRISISLWLYFYSCPIFLGGFLSPSSVYGKFSFILSFIDPLFFSSKIVDQRNIFSYMPFF